MALIRAAQDEIHPKRLVRALEMATVGEFGKVAEFIGINRIANIAEAIRPELDSLVLAAGERTMRQIRSQANARLPSHPAIAFDLRHPSAERWARKRSGLLIEDITKEGLKVVRWAIESHLSKQWTYDKTSRVLRNTLGMNSRQAVAHERYVSSIERSALSPKAKAMMIKRDIERKLRYRAEMISRTETIAAINAGQDAAWDQLSEAGLLNRATSQKEWVTTIDDRECDDCVALDGVRVALDEQFPGADHPPLHPNCRCAVVLVFEEE